jgi:HlyD family secretion protein
VDTQTLKNMSLSELQESVDHLREDLEKLINFVHAQEQELTIQIQCVSQLQEQIPQTSQSELPQLKADLADQQEKAKMLEETLIGQYRNLHKREVIFKQYLLALLEKQGLLQFTENGENLDLKLILGLLDQQEKLPTSDKKTTSFLQQKWFIPSLIIVFLFIIGTLVYTLKILPNQSTPEVTPVVKLPEKTAVTALGRIEPSGEVVKISAASSREGAKMGELLVKEGDMVESGQIVAILDDFAKKQATLRVAQEEIKVAKANLAIIKAGAKQGEINAQIATINRLKAQLKTEIQAKQANISRLKAQLTTETLAQEANLSRLQSQLKNAQLEFKRYEKLVLEGVIRASELDTRRTTLETAEESVKEAQANLQRIGQTLTEQIREAQALNDQSIETLTLQIREAEANLAKIEEVRGVDIVKGETELQKTQAFLQQQEADLELSKIKAPTKGQILKIHAYPGENINTETGIAELGQTQQMMVVAEVYESDIGKVKIGQEATMTSESGAFDSEIKGTVREIGWQVGKKDVLSSDPAADVDVRVVEVKIQLNPESSKLVSNLTYGKVIVKIFI